MENFNMIKEEKIVEHQGRPCKFCGHKPKLRWFSLYFDEKGRRYSILCSNVNCSNSVPSAGNLQATINQWNLEN